MVGDFKMDDKIKLLWTNPNPTSEFQAQSISAKLTKYDEVFIDCNSKTSGGAYITAKVPIGESVELFGFWTVAAFRKVTVSNTGVEFAAGEYMPTYNTSTRYSANDAMIPLRIYGIITD